MINRTEIGILGNLFVDTFQRLIFYQLCNIQQFDAGNVILFQIKVFGRNIKETKLARYLKKVTARPSFTQLRVIRRIIGFIKYENRKYVTKIQLYFLI